MIAPPGDPLLQCFLGLDVRKSLFSINLHKHVAYNKGESNFTSIFFELRIKNQVVDGETIFYYHLKVVTMNRLEFTIFYNFLGYFIIASECNISSLQDIPVRKLSN